MAIRARMDDYERNQLQDDIQKHSDKLTLSEYFTLDNLDPYYTMCREEKFKVKLCLIDLDWWKSHSKIAAIAQYLIKAEYGLVHTALHTGPYLIHWFDDELVHIEKVESNTSIVAIDLIEFDLDSNDRMKFCDKVSNYLHST
jgi:hypothetical protein